MYARKGRGGFSPPCLLGHNILRQNPSISPPCTEAYQQSCAPSTTNLCGLAGARALGGCDASLGGGGPAFGGSVQKCGVQGGSEKCSRSLLPVEVDVGALLSPCWLEGAERVMALLWPPSKAMASGCVHSPLAAAPSPWLGRVSLSKTSSVVFFSFLFKWPLFTFFHALPPWHAGRQGEGAFS